MDPTKENTEAATVAALTRQALALQFSELKNPDRSSVLVFPDKSIRSLEALASTPKRKRANVSIGEAKSFIDYVRAHTIAGSTCLFGASNELGGSFTAILDYHNANKDGTELDARWCEHRACFTLVTTTEWKRWVESNGRPMPQETFSEFIEDNLTDIIKPDAAELLETAQLLTGKKGATFRSGKNLKNGTIDFQYTEQIEVGGGRRDDALQVPDRFTLGIVPFVGANGVEITARLRFRISDSGKLSFTYLLDRPHKIVEEAFNVTRADIEQALGLPVILGSAETPKVTL